MIDCERARNLLVLYLEGELTAEERLGIREHLAGCAACRTEVAKIESVRSALADPALLLPQDYGWQLLPRTLAARASEVSRVKTWLPANLGASAWGASLAAFLVMGCALIWLANRPGQDREPVAQQAALGNNAFLKQMEAVHARESTSQYLSQCQNLLLNVMRAEKSCQGDKHDVSVEVSQARDLLQRKRLLDSELRRPEVARAKELCDELETFLLDLSTSDKCESSSKLHAFERVIQREQLLLRINLLQSELS